MLLFGLGITQSNSVNHSSGSGDRLSRAVGAHLEMLCTQKLSVGTGLAKHSADRQLAACTRCIINRGYSPFPGISFTVASSGDGLQRQWLHVWCTGPQPPTFDLA